MKTTELMIGDYITIAESLNDERGPLIFQVVALNCSGEGAALMLLKGQKACDEMEIDDEWSGIPITPAILEENGFGEQIFERMSVWSILGFSIELNFSTWKYYWANGDVEISSVHELQHCLKLCGIEKEIVL